MSGGCEDAIEYIYEYLDDELPVLDSSRIRLHLKRCSTCMSAYDFEAKLKGVIRERGRSEPPPELFDTLRTLIQQESEQLR
jgi:mycothiol system anti-sigma-R factor